MEKKELELQGEYITLSQLLKAVDIASSGGIATMLIKQERCFVNDELCTQKGKKLRVHDNITVVLDEQQFQIKIV